MSADLIHAAIRGVAKRMGERKHAESQNQLLRIGGKIVTMGEACKATGLNSKEVRKRVRAGTLDLAGFA